jgi:folate-binding protein YgfZ
MSRPLRDIERAAGITLVEIDGVSLPARFTSLEREWGAVRRRCGVLDAGFRAVLQLVGEDRVSFLQGMISNDVAVLQPGGGTYAAFLTQQGRIVSDLRVYRTAEALLLDVPAGRLLAVRAGLERFIIADDVDFADSKACIPLLALEGPQAREILCSSLGEEVDQLPPYSHRDLPFQGSSLRIAAASHTGESGFLLLGDPMMATDLWKRCCAAGAEPVGMEALDVLRVEAGVPWYGRDMDESYLVSEVGLEAAISYRKGCYLGQEVVERVAARGQVHRKLVCLAIDGDTPPASGALLVHDGKEIGRITSAVWSPARKGVLALGYVRREGWAPGTRLVVSLAEGGCGARVEVLPYYQRA